METILLGKCTHNLEQFVGFLGYENGRSTLSSCPSAKSTLIWSVKQIAHIH